MRRAEHALDGRPESIAQVRRFAKQVLAEWGCDDLAWAVTLLSSELATNAVLHARSSFTVALEECPEGVRLEITDTSPRLPARRSYSAESTTGRGLRILNELADSWGAEAGEDGGKTVWAVIRWESDERGGRTDLAEADPPRANGLAAQPTDVPRADPVLHWRSAA
jgi:anti-sigma regulatory factor (Ser/Thr protein kinase)